MGEGITIKATPAEQARLLDLQAVDTALDQHRHRRQNLPEQAELKSLAADHAQASEELVGAETQVSDLELAVAKAESDLTPVRERRERNQQRIADGSVGDPKALSTMIEEVDHLARRISDLEDVQLEVMEQHEEAVAVRDRLAAQKAEIATRGSEVRGKRDVVVAEIDAAMAELGTDREAIAAVLPDPLLQQYEKIRAGHGGLGAVALLHRRCNGCQIEANAADLRAYATAAEDDLLRCEECGRILVRTEESGL